MESTLKLAIFIGLVCCALANNPLKEVYSWKQVDFEYPDESARQEAIRSKEFIPENNLPLGIERWKNKLFVTFPRWKDGTAATLTYLDLESELTFLFHNSKYCTPDYRNLSMAHALS